MATSEAKHLVQKAASVMAQVEHVPKNGWNDFHKYHYATEADITTCVRAAMAEQGLMLIPTVDKVEWTKVPSKSGEDRLATLTVKFTLTDGVDKVEFVVLGEGQDRGDKATYKAMTGALKYALLKLFLIPTGDDPEKEEGDKPEQQKPPMQRPVQAPPQSVARPAPTDASAAAAKARASRAAKIWERVHAAGVTAEGFQAWVKEALGEPKPSGKWTDEDMAKLDAAAGRLEDVA